MTRRRRDTLATMGAVTGLSIALAACERPAEPPESTVVAEETTTTTVAPDAEPTGAVPDADSLPRAAAAAEGQAVFEGPDDAVEALGVAAAGLDHAAIDRIFGPHGERLMEGEAQLTDLEILRFAASLERRSELVDAPEGDGSTVWLIVDDERRVFPVPIQRGETGWFFDTLAGVEEVRSRRVHANELHTIETCRALVDAQEEYALVDRDGDGESGYALRMSSTPGTRDGLYWSPAPADDAADAAIELSPIGPLLAEAWVHDDATSPAPYFGYFYRLIPADEGFAFIAYPAAYGRTGLMTYMVGPDATVHEFDLGEQTAERAYSIERFDPDGWFTVGESS